MKDSEYLKIGWLGHLDNNTIETANSIGICPVSISLLEPIVWDPIELYFVYRRRMTNLIRQKIDELDLCNYIIGTSYKGSSIDFIYDDFSVYDTHPQFKKYKGLVCVPNFTDCDPDRKEGFFGNQYKQRQYIPHPSEKIISERIAWATSQIGIPNEFD